MGLRGPLPMSPEERAERGGGRARTVPPRVLDGAHRRALERRATELEALGLRMVKAAGTKGRGKKAGAKLDQLYAGLKVLNAADKLWARLDRLGGATRVPTAPGKPVASVPSLSDYGKRRPSA